MSNLLKEYIELALSEGFTHIPKKMKPKTKLPDVSKKKKPHQKTENEQMNEDELEEASTTADIAGYTLPLGMSPQSMFRRGPAKKKRRTLRKSKRK